jgi:hypothetical protein
MPQHETLCEIALPHLTIATRRQSDLQIRPVMFIFEVAIAAAVTVGPSLQIGSYYDLC